MKIKYYKQMNIIKFKTKKMIILIKKLKDKI